MIDDNQSDDRLKPARGIVNGLKISALIWCAIAVAAYVLYRLVKGA